MYIYIDVCLYSYSENANYRIIVHVVIIKLPKCLKFNLLFNYNCLAKRVKCFLFLLIFVWYGYSFFTAMNDNAVICILYLKTIIIYSR